MANTEEHANCISADLILLHAPSVFDFRNRRDVLFPYVASDSVAVSSIFEIYPLGFKSIEAYLGRHGISVRVINLAALMLRKWDLDVPAFLGSLRAHLFGIDLHWVVHAHGALALADLLKTVHPSTPTILGGISSTYYAEELMGYRQIDMVMRGFDTHEPLRRLIERIKRGGDGLESIPNLSYRDARTGLVHVNDFSHKPHTLECETAADWSPFLQSRQEQSPAMMVLPSTGCAYNCGWCGGSRDAVTRIMQTTRTVASRPPEALTLELASMTGAPAATRANIYTLNAYNFSARALSAYLDGVKTAGIRDVAYEQFHLTPRATLQRMVDAARTTINLSPESHDIEISRLAGRGNYTMDQMEEWIEEALALGVFTVHIWFFLGMPRQTASSVIDTVAYCRHLMERFRGQRVIPILTPMVPFLDPGCNYFVEPEKWGYTVFFKSLEEHRQALVHPSWLRRLNYETQWMSRAQIASLSYDAVDMMTEAKSELGMLPRSTARNLIDKRKREKDLVFRIADLWEIGGTDAVIAIYGNEIRLSNEQAFRAGVSDQIFPIPRALDNRWFDEFEIDR